MCYTHFVPKGRLLTLRQYKIIYQEFPFVKHFFVLGIFFCIFSVFLAISGKNGKNCGTAPESEPETRVLADLCRNVSFRHAVALHTQGEEIYWRYGAHTPPQSRMMARVLSAVSGYALADPSESSAHGGFKDWFIDCFHRPAFTLELGRGQNPLPLREFESIYAKAREMLLLSLLF